MAKSDSDDAGNESGAVDIIQKAVDYISECIARASESTENSEKAERRVKRARITEYTNELIAFRSERDPYEKRRINCTKATILSMKRARSENPQLSFYLWATEAERRARLALPVVVTSTTGPAVPLGAGFDF